MIPMIAAVARAHTDVVLAEEDEHDPVNALEAKTRLLNSLKDCCQIALTEKGASCTKITR